ncbi:MAG: 2OG-Fe(II) oxygenase [Rhodospirillaceae bacterium]|nr:2OG-Fe(II) oxygenase [Rhodospirillaceae bacterium]MDD9917132.1 2OG-Fe(II) oxygenase [Rhodospirillaceae bacterium]MDD9924474.1 2OG-Fe(II) oxygenase [Rhodospirillaceae bacterium]
MGTWQSNEAQPLSPESLDALFSNRIPAIRIPGFANPAECRAFAEGLRRCKLRVVKGATDHSAPSFEAQKIAFIGLTQFEFKYKPIEDYLDAAEASRTEVAPVFAASFNPVERLMGRLRDCVESEVAIASDPGGRAYSATIIRSSNEGLALHADFAPYQAPQLTVSDCTAQLAWNFYAEVPGGAGGHTTLHNSPWSWQRNRDGEIAENYPLPYSAVEGAQSFTFRPEEGDVVLFNSRNPHEVFPVAEPNGKDRIAMATFIGRKPNGDLHLWS